MAVAIEAGRPPMRSVVTCGWANCRSSHDLHRAEIGLTFIASSREQSWKAEQILRTD